MADPKRGTEVPGSESVFVLPVFDRWLLYAPLHGISALLNRQAVAQLRASGGWKLEGQLAELADATAAPVSAPGPREGPFAPEFLGIIPTRACNLRCLYCGFGAGDAKGEVMDTRMATTVVDWMAETSQELGRNHVDIHFFGGEPFVAMDLVDVVVHRGRAQAAARGLRARFQAATNGVYSEDTARFIGDYFDTVALSLDGPAEIHDRHRPRANGHGSFQTVARTARVLRDSPTNLCLRISVTQASVEQLEKTVQWFCEDFASSIIDVETLQPTPESCRAGLSPPDPFAFAIQFERSRRTAAGFGIDANYASAMRERPRATFCPVGNDTVIVSPDGCLSACYLPQREWRGRGLDLNLGRASPAAIDIDTEQVARVRAMVTSRPRCEKCFCRWSCAGGCHVHHSYPGCLANFNNFCVQTRLITAAELLDELDCDTEGQRFVECRPAAERLAWRSSDRLLDWRETDG